MQKIPVGQTISAAYRFAFGDAARVFGIAWFPLFLILICTLTNAALSFHLMGEPASANPNYPFAASGLGRLNAIMVLINIAMFVLRCMIVCGLTEEALTPSPQRRWFYFSLGGKVWTMALSYFLFALILIGVIIGLALVFGIGAIIAGMAAAAQGRPSAHSVVLLLASGAAAMLLVIVLMIYLSLRCTFLISPVVVTQGDIGVGGSWRLMRGNVGRGFAVCVSIFLPLAVLGGAIAFFLFGPMLMGPIRDLLNAGLSGASSAQLESTMKVWGAAIAHRAFTLLPVTLALGFAFSAFFHALFAAASSHAYRALTVGQPSSTV